VAELTHIELICESTQHNLTSQHELPALVIGDFPKKISLIIDLRKKGISTPFHFVNIHSDVSHFKKDVRVKYHQIEKKQRKKKKKQVCLYIVNSKWLV
jgi:hypothetical protein